MFFLLQTPNPRDKHRGTSERVIASVLLYLNLHLESEQRSMQDESHYLMCSSQLHVFILYDNVEKRIHKLTTNNLLAAV